MGSIVKDFKWSRLEFFGKNKVLNTSFIWMFILPTISKFLENINLVHISIGGKLYSFNITLPFSWYNLYFSSFFFTFGMVLYTIFCPSIIKKYKNYQEFIDSGKGSITLINYYEKVWNILKEKETEKDALKEFAGKFCNEKISDKGYDIALINPKRLILYSENMGDAFWYIRYLYEQIGKIPMWLCLFFYSLGSIFIIVVIIDNFITVLKLLFRLN